MVHETIHPPEPPRTIYYSAHRTNLLIVMGTSAVIAALNAFALLRQFQWLDVVGLIGALLLMSLSYAHLATTRLIVTPSGIDYTCLGYHVRTTWENAEQIVVVRMWYGVAQHGLILRHSALQGRPGGWWLTPLYRQGRFIPLLSAHWYNYSGLERELRQYAPYLFR